MNTTADKTQENKSQSVANEAPQVRSGSTSTFQFEDNRPEAVAQRKLQEMANSGSRVSQLSTFQNMTSNSPDVQQTTQLQSMTDNNSAQQQIIQKVENNTGLPDNLKTGMENLSGLSLDDVKVHRNSDKPAQLQAHAYAQGTNIHLGPGQEKHLSHEAWHVVQQKQGRVKPTLQMKGNVNVNDDSGLEKEADVMGAKALQMKEISINSHHASTLDVISAQYPHILQAAFASGGVVQRAEDDSIADMVWDFIGKVQGLRFADSFSSLIQLASAITLGVSAFAKDNVKSGMAGASLKLTTDLGTLVAAYGEFRKPTNDGEEGRKRKQDLIQAGIVVIGDIATVVAAYYGGAVGALVGIGITAAAGKLVTSIWGDIRGHQQDGENQRLMV